MSSPYTGNYSFDLSKFELNSKKRYIMAAQMGRPILDSELTEVAFSSLMGLRNYIRANVSDGSIDDAFKIVEASNNVNNFMVVGGTGSVDTPAMMFVKGIPVVSIGSFDYNTQSPTQDIDADDYTQTLLPGLTTPIANRTDIVYIDIYFAEVNPDSGSEYRDTTLKNTKINMATANRFRLVQDVRVAEGAALPADGNDANGIYHRYLKLATINRLAGNNTITSAMIVDERFVTISIKKLTDGTGVLTIATLNTTDINLSGDLIPNEDGTSNLGDSDHRFANLYMSSNIDSTGGLSINHSGSVGQALKITRSGSSLGNLLNVADLLTVDNTGQINVLNSSNSTSSSSGSMILSGGLGISKDVYVGGSLSVPIISGNIIFTGDVTIQGTTTTVSATNLVVTDKNIIINDGGNDASSEGAGITVDRTSINGSLIYRSSAPGKFAIGDLGSEQNIVIDTRAINVSSPITGGGNLSSNLTIGINASSANTANFVVQRDSSGNFNAGMITLSSSPSSPTHVTTKQYVDDTFAMKGSLSPSLPVFTNGSSLLVTNTMTGTGSVVMSSGASLTSPTLGGAVLITGTLTLNSGPSSSLEAATKQYVDDSVAGGSGSVQSTSGSFIVNWEVGFEDSPNVQTTFYWVKVGRIVSMRTSATGALNPSASNYRFFYSAVGDVPVELRPTDSIHCPVLMYLGGSVTLATISFQGGGQLRVEAFNSTAQGGGGFPWSSSFSYFVD